MAPALGRRFQSYPAVVWPVALPIGMLKGNSLWNGFSGPWCSRIFQRFPEDRFLYPFGPWLGDCSPVISEDFSGLLLTHRADQQELTNLQPLLSHVTLVDDMGPSDHDILSPGRAIPAFIRLISAPYLTSPRDRSTRMLGLDDPRLGLNDLLTRYKELTVPKESTSQRAQAQQEIIVGAFDQLTRAVIRPAMERIGTKLERRGHEYEIVILRGQQITMRFYPPVLPRSAYTPSCCPYVSLSI
jgi:hypothetical protein